ncbi:hypothetical protein [Flavobacterium sp.]|uniref:hypothetical protein n=1 Tax=Flavobacterium sp. TaxID=239 RepID=UPI003750D9C8
MLIRFENRKSKVESSGRKIFFLLPFAFCLLPFVSNAQCAMCRASLESSGNVSQAEAVNDGIIYLMIIPYVLVALIAFAVYRMYNKKK